MSLTRRTESRSKLFTAGMELVGRHGPDGVTVEQIAAGAGVAKGTVYYQFGSKQALVGALLDHGFALMLEALEPGMAQDDPIQGLRSVVSSALDFVDAEPSFVKLWITEAWRPNSPWLGQLLQMRAQLLQLIVDQLVRIDRAHPELPGRDGEQHTAVALALFGATYTMALNRQVPGAEAVDRHVEANTVMALVTTGYLGTNTDGRGQARSLPEPALAEHAPSVQRLGRTDPVEQRRAG